MTKSDAVFAVAIEKVLQHEGLFSNDPSDRGGATNYGVSLRWLQSQGLDINLDGIVDESDVKMLTRRQAVEFYKKHWWDRYSYSKIKDADVAGKVLDLAINMGPKQAHTCLQRALHSHHSMVQIDGVIGPKTRAAVNLVEQPLCPAFRSEAAAFYRILVAIKPQYKRFEKGWLRRAYA